MGGCSKWLRFAAQDRNFTHNICTFISDMVVYQRFGRHDFQYRQFGEGVKERVSTASIGINIFDFFHSNILEVSEYWWNALLDHPCGGITEYDIQYPNGIQRDLISILLPVLDKKHSATMMVGLNKVLAQTGREAQTGKVVIGQKSATATFFDIGFGVPDKGEIRP